MMRAAIIAMMLATPAMAQDWKMVEFLTSDLDDEKPGQAFGAAIAACMLGQGDAAKTAALFTDAGWTLTADAEMGLNQIASPHASLSVLAATDGSFCAVDSMETGTDVAASLLLQTVSFAGLGTSVAPGPGACTSLQVTPAIAVEVTSSGQDPVCDDPTNSAVRFYFSAP
ncbi:MAG: hypothetical protein MUD11_04560 [Rhodobacteraceae bacterium]|nr:hypothetical protein [Paracoccaceae bacterium]